MEYGSRSHETVDLSQDGRRVVITLCRPEIHNAQNETLIDDLFDVTGGLRDRDDFDVVVLRSSGEHWCTGLDMKAHRNGWRPDRAFAERWDTAIANLQALAQIVVGLVDGYCLGGGVQLALGCDLRIATERAIFAIPASREVGLLGGMATWYLPRLLGISRAKALLLGGAVLNARQAAQWGLVEQVVPAGQLDAALEQIIGPLSADTLSSVGACKRIINSAPETEFDAAWSNYLEVQSNLMASPARDNRTREVLELMRAGRPPYLAVGWFPFDAPQADR
jgi:enoyl-CoA hydratase/carnithine racemase